MKYINITFLFVLLALVCSLSSTLAQDESPAAKRAAALTGRRPIGKSAKTSTTTPPPPAEDEEGDYGDENQENQYGDEGDDGAAASSTTTTTTEAPKKVGPVIRPFRSNDDLLNALRKRQQNAKKHKVAEKAAPRPKHVAEEEESQGDEEAAPAPAPSKGFKVTNPALSRRKTGKFGKSEAPVEEPAAEESETQKEETKVRRPHLALRRRN